jgi:ABC-type nitrate/sulfonate/bicarbonate transport system permease component
MSIPSGGDLGKVTLSSSGEAGESSSGELSHQHGTISADPKHSGELVRAGRFAEILPPFLTAAVLIALWQVMGRGTAIFPPPTKIVAALWRTRALLPAHIATTLTESLLGTFTGVVGGVAVALLTVAFPLVGRAVHPILITSQTVPVQILSPLLVLWFGFGLTPKIVVVALVVFFPVAVSTNAGLRTADTETLDLVRSLGASKRQQFQFLLAPAALPAALAGLRISLTYAVAAAAISEGIGATSGLGLYIARSQRGFRYDQMFAGVLVVTTLSIGLFSIVYVLDRVLCPWRHTAENYPSTTASR